MAAAEQGDQQLLDDLVLADDDAAQLLLDLVEGVLEPADGVEVVAGQVSVRAARRPSWRRQLRWE